MGMYQEQLVDLLNRIADGEKPTRAEQKWLKTQTQLNFNFTSLKSIDGLKECVNLQYLDLNGIRVADLSSLQNLTNLQTLYLNGTQVADISPLQNLSNLQKLYLSGTQVSDLSPLQHLSNLQELNLEGTQVADISPLQNLSNLQRLYLSGTQVSGLSPLQNLSNLQKLIFSDTQVADLSPLQNLSNLQELIFSDTQVADLSPLQNLFNLQKLYLESTQVSDLSPLQHLSNLQVLIFIATQVSDLSPLKNLSNLQELYFSDTQVADLSPLKHLSYLQMLDLRDTRLERIPKWIIDRGLSISFDFNFGNVILNERTQLTTQPLSLFLQPREFIEAYYNEQQIPVNEGKVIFLGDGGVGKTYTIARIENGGIPGDYHTETTPGVSITPYVQPGEPMINFWDFGGQEIMHSMHRCFLTERTCYVVVVSNRWTEVTRQARRWLKNIESFAPGASVILAVNQWENVDVWDLDITRLKTEFHNLQRVVQYTANDSSQDAYDKLMNAIREQVQALDSIRMTLPESWASVLRELRENTEYFLTKEDYHKMCDCAGITSPEIRAWLLEWFNDLGVCFSYHCDTESGEELEHYMVLDPKWLTNAIYIIVNNSQNIAKNGSMSYTEIASVLKNPEKSVLNGVDYDGKLQYVLEIMRKFRLSYPMGDKQEFIPVLCPNKTPDDLHPVNPSRHVHCELAYTYLPDSVVHQLMVLCCQKLNTSKCWLRGLFIDESWSGLSAVCDMGDGDEILKIDVYGEQDSEPWRLLRYLLDQLDNVNSTLNLKADCYICAKKGRQNARFRLDSLLKAKERGRTIMTSDADGEYEEYNIDELLGMVYGRQNLSIAEQISREQNKPLSEIVFLMQDLQTTVQQIGESLNRREEFTEEQLRSITETITSSSEEQARKILEGIRELKKKSLRQKFGEATGDVGKGVLKDLAKTGIILGIETLIQSFITGPTLP